MLSQVAKHLKTLIKYLRDIVAKTEDPVTIEQTQRQIKSIEKLNSDVKRAMRHSSMRIKKNKEESIFNLSASSCKSGMGRSSVEPDFKAPTVPQFTVQTSKPMIEIQLFDD